MTFFFSGVFLGSILILIGINLLIKHIFHIDLPLFRIIFSLIIIMVGVQILLGRSFLPNQIDDFTVIFQEKTFDRFPENKSEVEFNTIFGKSSITLSPESIPVGVQKIKLNTVFAGSEIFITQGLKVSLLGNSAFAGIQLPNGNTAAFGSIRYDNVTNATKESRSIDIEVNAVFGGVFVKDLTNSKDF